MALPLAGYWASRVFRLPATYLLAFFAGFCLVANGAYIGTGVFYPVGDALDLRKLGTPPWLLGIFGIAAVAMGVRLWNGLGKHFGIGANCLPVRWSMALTTTSALVVVIALEWALSDRA